MTTDPKFTITSLWKTRDGGKAMIVEVRDTSIVAYNYACKYLTIVSLSGCYYTSSPSDFDLLTPWVEPKTVRVHGWANVFNDGKLGYLHQLKTDADDVKTGRIACKELDFTVVEGEGL